MVAVSLKNFERTRADGEVDNGGTPPVPEPAAGPPWTLVLLGGFALIGGGLVVRGTSEDRDG